MRISPSPERGPEASQRTSLAILVSDAASVFSAPWAKTIASCAASASNLFGAETNGRPVRAASSAATRGAEVGRRVQAGADRRAAERQLAQVRQGGAHVRQAVVELGDPAGDLLAERERRRVLQVGAADLDDVGELLAPWRRASPAAPRGRECRRSRRRLDRGDAHRRREDVVRRLAAVDVVVRMHEPAFAERRRRAAARRGWRAPRSCSCCSACPSRSARPRAGTRRRACRRAPRRRRRRSRRPSSASSVPSSRLTTAALRLTSARARISSGGIFSVEMSK